MPVVRGGQRTICMIVKSPLTRVKHADSDLFFLLFCSKPLTYVLCMVESR